MSHQNIAELRGASRHFGQIIALQPTDLAVQTGELVALLGANGAGKTTAVRLFLGLLPPTDGVVRVFERDPRIAANRMSTGAMLQVGKVPETLKVREHITLFSSYYPSPRPLNETIALAGLTGIENRLFGELSGGQRQRVLFALAICGNPKFLVLDEPTVGLDVEARRSFWEVIRNLIGGGTSILLTTHYLAEADALADRVVVLDRGRVVASGTPRELKERSAGCTIRCESVLLPQAVREIEGVRDVRIVEGRLVITAASPEAIVGKLLRLDPALRHLEVTNAALEDAYIALTSNEALGEVA